MIDTLEANREKANNLSVNEILQQEIHPDCNNNSIKGEYALMTMHRPSNVDNKEILTSLFNFLSNEVTNKMPLIWPVHPRAEKQLKEFGLWQVAIQNPKLILLHPISYHEMLRLNMSARIMLTDSGGLQEECTVLGTPCLTLRWNTERPITLRQHGGASVLYRLLFKLSYL